MAKFAEVLHRMTEEAVATGETTDQAVLCLQLQEAIDELRVAQIVTFAEHAARLEAARGLNESHVLELDEDEDYEPAADDEGIAAEGQRVTLIDVAREVCRRLQEQGLEIFIRKCEHCDKLHLWIRW